MASNDGKLIQVAGVTVGRLKWKAYKRLKSEIINLLSKDAKTLIDALQLGVQAMQSGEKADFSAAAHVVVNAVSELNTLFAAGCIVSSPDGFNVDDLDLVEVTELFEAALKLNPLEELLAHEKNSPTGGLVQSLLKTLGSLPVSDLDGGSLLNQFWHRNTAGPLAASTN